MTKMQELEKERFDLNRRIQEEYERLEREHATKLQETFPLIPVEVLQELESDGMTYQKLNSAFVVLISTKSNEWDARGFDTATGAKNYIRNIVTDDSGWEVSYVFHNGISSRTTKPVMKRLKFTVQTIVELE